MRTTLRRIPLLAPLLLALAFAPALAQFEDPPPPEEMVRVSAAPVRIAAGAAAEAVVTLRIADTWHINAHPAANEDMIATELSLASGFGVTAKAPVYPAPKVQKLAFDENPLLVWDGETVVRVPLAAAANAVNGRHVLRGRVMFQACNDQVCLAPARVPFEVAIEVAGGVAAATADTAASEAAPAAPDTAELAAPAPGEGFVTAAPPGGSQGQQRRLEEALARGGVWWFVALFAGGLLLNLTPCVFPMLGITVSIFGARRKEPIGKVIAHAIAYVLGIAVMYSALGVVAALTGGLFGAALQNVWVSVGLGLLLVVLSLGMFGMYEMQPPVWIMDRLGGANTASIAGIFLSGLGVGIIAAPCVGPFVVAVLALIAARQDALFGFQTMFTLSLGLGFPYLVLAAFSNLLQSLPRSGDWMLWVKKVFGVLLAAIGLYYVLVGLAPRLSPWVLPGALAVGGVFLGFFARAASDSSGFANAKRIAGGAAALAGLVLGGMLVTAQARALEFRAFDEAAVRASLAQGRVVMVDVSAEWCVACHELENVTFADPRVVAAARDVDAFRLDLTKYDSPESEGWRRRYTIRGLPTVLFLVGDGREVAAARVEGFLKPEAFLERMKQASAATERAAAE